MIVGLTQLIFHISSLEVLKRLLSHHRMCTNGELQLLREILTYDISEYPIGEYVLPVV